MDHQPQPQEKHSHGDGVEDRSDLPGTETKAKSLSLRAAGQAAAGGAMMGLANLVPGISGGTMLLAAGIYPAFIDAIAEISTLRFRFRSIALLAIVACAAGAAIVLFAGPTKTLVVEHRFIMYSLFIGLTLGGVPVVWRLVSKPISRAVPMAALGGFLLMAALSWFQHSAGTSLDQRSGIVFMFLAGVAGASAMILPGVSGGYLLLVLGVYVPLLASIDALKESARGGNLESMWEPLGSVVLPVGVGVVIGVLLVSNALKYVLRHYAQGTYGCLLGLLTGAVIGLWPFQQGEAPAIGSIFKGQHVTEAVLAELSPDKFPTTFFQPSIAQVGLSLAAIAVGVATTYGVAAIADRAGAAP